MSGLLEAISLGPAPEERTALLRGGVQHAINTTLVGVYKVLFETLERTHRRSSRRHSPHGSAAGQSDAAKA